MKRNLFVHPKNTPTFVLEKAAPGRLSTRAHWAENDAEEQAAGAPDRRIIHARALFADTPLRVDTLRIVEAAGFFKDGAGAEREAAVHVRLCTPNASGWDVVKDIHTTPEEVFGGGVDVDLGGRELTGLVAQIRQADVDRWWPGWSLAMTGLVLEGEPTQPWAPDRESLLEVESLDLAGLPEGVTATHRNSEVRFVTPYLEVGFRLYTPGWSYFSVDEDGNGRTNDNLLQIPRLMDLIRAGGYLGGQYPVLQDQNAEYLGQGPRLTHHTGFRPIGLMATNFRGSVKVKGNSVTYDIALEESGQRYVLTFTVEKDRIVLDAKRVGSRELRAWTSSAWHIATDNRKTPSCTLGSLTFSGEAGLMGPEAIWHFPRYGSVHLTSTGDSLWRSDSVRSLDTNTLELKLGERATGFGDYVLLAGEHTSTVTFAVGDVAKPPVKADTPAVVAKMIDRHWVSAFAFRADTATYSNNGASTHATVSLDDISATAKYSPELLPGVHPMTLVGHSLARWLDMGPAYGGGRTSHGDHLLEDAYLIVGSNTMLGLGRFLMWDQSDEWFRQYRKQLVRATEEMLARDLDGDGLIESPLRLGISGEHQWSTTFCDCISFGWKCAWSNAALFDAWSELGPALHARGETVLAQRISEARTALQASYLPTFFNEDSGLIGGWRSKDGMLHDYAFGLVQGLACKTDLIPVAKAREIMSRLLDVWKEVGVPDLRNGLPVNAWRIPEYDIGGANFGTPMGVYMQGAMTHHSARHVVDALKRTGLQKESHFVLEALAETIADDSSLGGIGSGADWRMWDGTPSGYEGQLSESFSIMSTALRWYGTAAQPE